VAKRSRQANTAARAAASRTTTVMGAHQAKISASLMSAYTLMLSPEAELDIQEAVKYYDSVVQGLGLEFVNVIDNYFT
jgi:hypothetical protein